MTRKARLVAATALVVAGIAHEVAARWLAGTTLVAALLAPAGMHSVLVFAAALAFIGLRLALFVVVPGAACAVVASHLGRRVEAAWGRRRSVAARRQTEVISGGS